MIVCSCDALSEKFIESAVAANADAVRAETTDKRAAAVVWRATHPETPGDHRKRRCQSCLDHIRETIREMGLRGDDGTENAAPSQGCGTPGARCTGSCLSL